MSTLHYRSDIDGLRAIAVLAVVVFHAWPESLPGGFVGVDVFFVLSGYLISGIIFKGCRQGTFTFGDFYARRVRRIFPSLVAMLALCLAYGWLVLLPAEFTRLGNHVAWGGVFLQNVAFWRESGYFDTSAATKPILHLWSLAVEEQVYLVFPPIVLLAWRFRWPMLPLLAVLLVASLVACLVVTRTEPSAAFFLTPFRAWEFLAGSILAWMHDRHGSPAARTSRTEIASWCGLALLAFGLVWIEEGSGFPGWRAAIPVAGTTLMLAAGTAATPNRWLLSLKPLVWIGLISYPLYLFHWPLLSFLHIVKGSDASPWLVTAAVGLSFALATAAYLGLERPIRPSRWKGTVPTLVAAFLALGGVGLAITNGFMPSREPPKDTKLVLEALAEGTNWVTGIRRGYRDESRDGISIWRVGGDGPQTLLVGDSTIGMVAPRVRECLPSEAAGARGAMLVWGGGTIPIAEVTNPKRPPQQFLMPVFESVLAANPSIDRIVIGANWSSFFSHWTPCLVDGETTSGKSGRQKALSGLSAMVERLVKDGKKVFVILPVPTDRDLNATLMYTRDLLGNGTIRVNPLTIAEFRKRWRRIDPEEVGVVAAAAGAVVLDPVPALSRDGVLIAWDENGPVRTDSIHLRPAFSSRHATYVDPTVAESPEAPPWTRSDGGARDAPPPRPLRWDLGIHRDAEATLATSTDGVMRVEIQRLSGGPTWHVRLVSPCGPFEKGSRYVIKLRARSDAPRTISLLAIESAARSAPIGLVRNLELDHEWRDFRFDFAASADDEAARLRFNLGASDIPVEISDIEFTSER